MIPKRGKVLCIESHKSKNGSFFEGQVYSHDVVSDDDIDKFDFYRVVFLGLPRMPYYNGDFGISCRRPGEVWLMPPQQMQHVMRDFPGLFAITKEEVDFVDLAEEEEEVSETTIPVVDGPSKTADTDFGVVGFVLLSKNWKQRFYWVKRIYPYVDAVVLCNLIVGKPGEAQNYPDGEVLDAIKSFDVENKIRYIRESKPFKSYDDRLEYLKECAIPGTLSFVYKNANVIFVSRLAEKYRNNESIEDKYITILGVPDDIVQ